MNAELKKAGQRSLILGDRVGLLNPTGKIEDASVTRYAEIVSSNAEGSLGFVVTADNARSVRAGELCVRARTTNVRLYDARKGVVPPETLHGGGFDLTLYDLAKRGSVPMFQADTLHRTDVGGWRLGAPITILGDVTERGGSMLVLRKDGEAEQLFLLDELDYTPYALAILDERSK